MSQIGMLARMALDAEAIAGFEGDASRHATNTHHRVAGAIADFGVIQWMGVNDEIALFNALERLSADQKTLWTERLHDLHDRNRTRWGVRDETVNEIFSSESLPEDVSETLDVVILGDKAATIRGLPLDKGFWQRANEPELVLMDSVDVCATLVQMQNLRKSGNFARGELRDDVWRQLFALPASISNDVTLLDRYFIADLLKPHPSRQRNHAQWLIGALDRSLERGSSLRLLCELPDDMSAATARERLQRSLKPTLATGRLTRVEVVLAPWPTATAQRPHNRHVRFSCGVAISTDEGFDRLDRPSLQYLEGFTWRVATDVEAVASWSNRERAIVTSLNRVSINVL